MTIRQPELFFTTDSEDNLIIAIIFNGDIHIGSPRVPIYSSANRYLQRTGRFQKWNVPDNTPTNPDPQP